VRAREIGIDHDSLSCARAHNHSLHVYSSNHLSRHSLSWVMIHPRTHAAVCLSVLQCVTVCCSALQCVAVRYSALQCGAVCYSVLQCVAVCCSVLQYVAVCCSVLQCLTVRYSVLQCAAVCCSVLQCVAVWCSQMAHSHVHSSNHSSRDSLSLRTIIFWRQFARNQKQKSFSTGARERDRK